MSEKEAYRRKLQARLDELDAKMKELEAKARRKGAEAELKAYEAMREAERSRDEITDRLNDLRSRGEEAVAELRAGADAAVSAMSGALERAWSKFGKEE